VITHDLKFSSMLSGLKSRPFLTPTRSFEQNKIVPRGTTANPTVNSVYRTHRSSHNRFNRNGPEYFLSSPSERLYPRQTEFLRGAGQKIGLSSLRIHQNPGVCLDGSTQEPWNTRTRPQIHARKL
jgi:hypothetical protein